MSGDQSLYASVERRLTARIETPFSATVRGVDIDGGVFEEHAVLDNLSATGLAMRLVQRLAPGARLFVVIRLSGAPARQQPLAHVAVRGVVMRVELRSGGVFGVAVSLKHHRFFYSAQSLS